MTTGWEQMDGVTTETGVVVGGERPQDGEWGYAGRLKGLFHKVFLGLGKG